MRWRHLAVLAAGPLLIGIARAEVPLSRAATGHLTVPTMVNGKGPYEFVFDTGADETAVYAWFAKSLHLPKEADREISGQTGSAQMAGARLGTIAVDGHMIRHVNADVLPDRQDGVKLAGVAGVDLMMGRLAVIDFGCRTVALRPMPRKVSAAVGAGATLVEAGSILDGKQLTLPVTINGVTGVALLDTGSRDSRINRIFASAAGADPASAGFRDADPIYGASLNPVTSRIGPVGTVGFAGITRPNAEIRVIDLTVFDGAGLAKGPAMILGIDLLQGTRLTVDYASRRFWLAPSSCASAAGQKQ
jgi:predicted aspartyl protease